MITHKRLKGYKMFTSNIPLNSKATWRKKAQTNICMAKELVDIFGGSKADYLKKLNHRLRMRIAENYGYYSSPFAKAA
jgi:hypothetical protein